MLVMFIYLCVILPRYRGSSRHNTHTHRRKYCEKSPEKNYGTFGNRSCIYPDLHFVSVVSAGASWLKKKKKQGERQT